jgi:hypothetical protein
MLTDEQVSDILKLYAAVKHTKQIDIQNIDKSILSFYLETDNSVKSCCFLI